MNELTKWVINKMGRHVRVLHAKQKTYQEYGHDLYEEAKDFNNVVYEFCCGE